MYKRQGLTPADVEKGKRFIDEGRITIRHQENAPDTLYIKVVCHAKENRATAVIQGSHTSFSYIEKNGTILLEKKTESQEEADETIWLTFQKTYDYAILSPIEELANLSKNVRLRDSLTYRGAGLYP